MLHIMIKPSITATLAAAAFLFVPVPLCAQAAPYIPDSGSTVLERLPDRQGPGQREMRQLRQALAADPQNLRVAIALVRLYIGAWRDGGDPRYLGYAQAALQPWWNSQAPPPVARLMRATLLQSTHRFSDALADLDAVVRDDPGNAQAWLTRATVQQVTGNYAQAQQSCEALAGKAPALVVRTCLSGVEGMDGEAVAAYQRLEQAIRRNPVAEPEIRIWALTLLAEMAERLGDEAAARSHYDEALAVGMADGYLLAAYCDFLLDRDQPQAVVALLKNRTQTDALLLRHAIALKRLGTPDAARYRTMLAERFEAAKMRGDTLHQREYARFLLDLEDAPAQALKTATQNWQTQKEPADTLLFVRAAALAHDRDAARPVLEWLKSMHIEDRRLAPWLARLQG
jgi:Tfp pilus assembly protein PilF